jgi:glutamate racemase
MRPIGILDSGVGGLSVFKAIADLMPEESTIYIADSKNAPYGAKKNEEILRLSKQLIEFLLNKNVKLIVVACNTITVSCIDILRKEHPEIPIIGTVPVVKTAAAVTINRKIGIFSTSKTAKSTYQKELINKFAVNCHVTAVGTDELVPLIEQGLISGKYIQQVLKRVLQPFLRVQCDAIALACTHYPFIKNEIGNVLGSKVLLLEPSGAIARHAQRILTQNNTLVKSETKGKHEFYTTGDAQMFSKVAKKLAGVKIEARHQNLDSRF